MRKVVLALVAALSALLAVPAMAVDGTFSSATPAYKWSGGPGNGAGNNSVPPTPGAGFGNARCTDVYQCENIHIELKEPGSLAVDIKAGEGSEDLDVRLWPSDAQGTAPGGPKPGDTAPPKPIAEDTRTAKDAKMAAKGLKPGFYVIQVAFFSAQEGVYEGNAQFTPAAPPASSTPTDPPATTQPAPSTAPAPAPAAQPAPAQTSPTPAQIKADDSKRKKALAKCNKKAKKVKNAKKRKAAMKKCASKYAKKR